MSSALEGAIKEVRTAFDEAKSAVEQLALKAAKKVHPSCMWCGTTYPKIPQQQPAQQDNAPATEVEAAALEAVGAALAQSSRGCVCPRGQGAARLRGPAAQPDAAGLPQTGGDNGAVAAIIATLVWTTPDAFDRISDALPAGVRGNRTLATATISEVIASPTPWDALGKFGPLLGLTPPVGDALRLLAVPREPSPAPFSPCTAPTFTPATIPQLHSFTRSLQAELYMADNNDALYVGPLVAEGVADGHDFAGGLPAIMAEDRKSAMVPLAVIHKKNHHFYATVFDVDTDAWWRFDCNRLPRTVAAFEASRAAYMILYRGTSADDAEAHQAAVRDRIAARANRPAAAAETAAQQRPSAEDSLREENARLKAQLAAQQAAPARQPHNSSQHRPRAWRCRRRSPTNCAR